MRGRGFESRRSRPFSLRPRVRVPPQSTFFALRERPRVRVPPQSTFFAEPSGCTESRRSRPFSLKIFFLTADLDCWTEPSGCTNDSATTVATLAQGTLVLDAKSDVLFSPLVMLQTTLHSNRLATRDQELNLHEQAIKFRINFNFFQHQVREFNSTYMTKDTRKEWILSDPKALQREAPTRMGDDDPRLGLSSIQVRCYSCHIGYLRDYSICSDVLRPLLIPHWIAVCVCQFALYRTTTKKAFFNNSL